VTQFNDDVKTILHEIVTVLRLDHLHEPIEKAGSGVDLTPATDPKEGEANA
jgi:hypothetical protein